MISVEYPNDGSYEGGQPRWTVRDKTGTVTFARGATDEEAKQFAVVDALDRNTDQMQQLVQHMHNLETYGISLNK